MLISLVEYAEKNGKDPANARQMAARGGFKTAHKLGRIWVIEDTELWPDRRLKSGKYTGWYEKYRKKK